MSDAGFELRKWKTDNRELQKYFDSDSKSDLFIVCKYTTFGTTWLCLYFFLINKIDVAIRSPVLIDETFCWTDSGLVLC